MFSRPLILIAATLVSTLTATPPLQITSPLKNAGVISTKPTPPASQVRAKGYILNVQIAVPQASTTATQLSTINPHLTKALPDLPSMLTSATVSSRYKQLYDTKLEKIRSGEPFTAHNYFDCETILRLTHPTSKQKVLLVQADMDCVTDGSDPGRFSSLASYNEARISDWYLPQTSYSWTKSGITSPNPFLSYYSTTLTELTKVRSQLAARSAKDPGVVWRQMVEACDAQIYRVKMRGLTSSTKSGLTSRRYLLSTMDPFVVLPKNWVLSDAEFAPNIGDYALVIHKDKILPAILGDAGPTDKIGEASLKIAKMVNPKASGKMRAISDLSVTYLFFPKSKDPFKTPNLTAWHAACQTYLTRIGGLAPPYTLHKW